MGVFNDLGKKISQSSQDAVKKAKDFTEISKLNSQISDEEKLINNYYKEIGEKYFLSFGMQPSSEFAELCNNIVISNEKITKLKEEIVQIKNMKVCPNCGAECAENLSFCGSCGEPLAKIEVQSTEEIKKFCSNCGTQLTGGATFCTNCGQKQQ